MRPLFVEFIGLPGSGKSSIARKLHEILIRKGYRAASRPQVTTAGANRIRHSASYLAYHLKEWRLMWSLIQYGVSIHPYRRFRIPKLRKVLFSCYYFDNQGGEHDIILLDQFGVQALWGASMYGTWPNSGAVGEVLAAISQNGSRRMLLVHIDVEPAVAAHRISAGKVAEDRPGRYRFDLLSSAEAESAFASGRTLLRDLSERIATMGVPVIKLNGVQSAEASAAAVVACIDSMFCALQS